jgi:hypothetical protein
MSDGAEEVLPAAAQSGEGLLAAPRVSESASLTKVNWPIRGGLLSLFLIAFRIHKARHMCHTLIPEAANSVGLLMSFEIITVRHVLMTDQARCSCRAGYR